MGLIVRNINFTGNFRGTFPQVPPPPPAPPAPSDQYGAYTVLDLPGTGTNNTNNNVFVDSSANNFAITRVGNTTQGSFSPFSTAPGYWSNYFDGGSSLQSSVSGSTPAQLGTGDFTIEAWVNLTRLGSTADVETWGPIVSLGRFFSSWTSNSRVAWMMFLDFTNFSPCAIRLSTKSGNGFSAPDFYTASSSAISITTNSWNHIAITRQGSVLKFWFNGALVGTDSSRNWSTIAFDTYTEGLFIGDMTGGRSGEVRWQFPGYISNVRVVKGTAIYTNTFTPSTSPLTTISGTVLLAAQNNRFIDNSSSSYSFTASGLPSASAFGPYAPVSSYNAATMGGSIYFDGSGDYLTVPSNAPMELSNNNFTIECWINTTSRSQYDSIISRQPALGPVPGSWTFLINSASSTSGDIAFWSAAYNSWASPMLITSEVNVCDGAWHHIALVRNGSNWAIYVDGISRATQTSSITIGNNNGQYWIGNNQEVPNRDFPGYISNFRYVVGTAVYTSNFTPPTAPVTAISGTSLLLNGTNGAIIDQSVKNNIETLGDAKVSTTVSANGSMYFDGNGDYLKIIPRPADYYFGAGDFTIEMWVRLNSFSDGLAILSYGWPGGAPFLIYQDGVFNRISFYSSSNGSSWDIADRVTIVSSPVLNTWYHIAVTRSGNTIRTFSNGSLISTVTSSGALLSPAATVPLTVAGGSGGSQNSNILINNLRITKGIARYTSNFTPPTRS